MTMRSQQSLEKRKVRSRDAARVRRGTEAEIFSDLAECLPIPKSVATAMDKGSLLRLATNFIKLRSSLPTITGPADGLDNIFLNEPFPGPLEALGGFFVMTELDGTIVYASANIEQQLDVHHLDIIGGSLFDYVLPADNAELQESIANCGHDTSLVNLAGHLKLDDRVVMDGDGHGTRLTPRNRINEDAAKCFSILIRFKTSKSRKSSKPSSKVFRVSGSHAPCGSRAHNYVSLFVEPLMDIWRDIDSTKGLFFSKHSLDMRFVFVEESVNELLGYAPSDLIGTTIYELLHPSDVTKIATCFKTLLSKGAAESPAVRLLLATGGQVWIVVQLTRHADTVLAVTELISEPRDEHCVLALGQLKESVSRLGRRADLSVNVTPVGHGPELSELDDCARFAPSEQSTPLSEGQGDEEDYDEWCRRVLKDFEKATANNLPALPELEDSVCNPWDVEPTVRSATGGIFAPAPPDLENSVSNPWDSEVTIRSTTGDIFKPLSDEEMKRSQAFLMPIDALPTASDNEASSVDTLPTGDDLARDIDLSEITVIDDGQEVLCDESESVNCDAKTDKEIEDLTHLAPEAGDTFTPLDLDSLPCLEGLDMETLLKDMGYSSKQDMIVNCDVDAECVINEVLDHQEVDKMDMARHLPSIKDGPMMAVDKMSSVGGSFEDSDLDSNLDMDSGIGSTAGTPPYTCHSESPTDMRPCPSLNFGQSRKLTRGGSLSSEGSGSSTPCSPDPSEGHELARPVPCASPQLNSDPFLSFTGSSLLDSFVSNSAQPGHAISSVWNSPPSSSTSSSLVDGELDLCNSMDELDYATGGPAEGMSPSLLGSNSKLDMSDFPLLSDDSIWDSFINSNLSDIINTDAFLPDAMSRAATELGQGHAHLADCSNLAAALSGGASSSSAMRPPPPPPPLPLTSNLAMLLQQSTPLANSSSPKSSPIKPTTSIRATPSSPKKVTLVGHPGASSSANGSGSTNCFLSGTNILVQNGAVRGTIRLTSATGKDGLNCNQQLIFTTSGAAGPSTSHRLTASPRTPGGANHIIINYSDLASARKLSAATGLVLPLKRQLPVESGSQNSTSGATAVKRLRENGSATVKNAPTTVTTNSSALNGAGSSVLMNLLVNGEDVSNGYSRLKSLRAQQLTNCQSNQHNYGASNGTSSSSMSSMFNGDPFISESMAIGVSPFGDIR